MRQDQSSCFETGFKIVAIVLVVGLIFSMPIALLGRSFGRVIFRPEILTNVLRESLLGSGVLDDAIRSDIFAREVFGALSGGEQQVGRFFEYLSPGEREDILLALMPAHWIEEQFTRGVRDFFTWLNDDQLYPKLSLDIGLLKANLLGGGITKFIETVVDSWPSCKPEQVEQMQQLFFEGGRLPEDLCEPPEPLRGRVIDLASIAFEGQVRTLPEVVPLVEPEGPADDYLAFKEQFRFFRAISLWGWMLPLSLLGVIMALAIRKWRDFGRWWGLPLLLGGLGTLLIALFMAAVRTQLISSWSSSIRMEVFQDLFKIALQALYSAGLRPLWLQGIVIVILGIGLWLLGRRGTKKSVQASPLEPVERVPVVVEKAELDDQDLEDEDQGQPPMGIFG